MNAPKPTELLSFLRTLLNTSPPESLQWLQQKTDKLSTEFSEKDFYLAFSLLPRFFAKEQLHLTDAQLQQATQLKQGYSPADYTAVQAARTFLALHIPQHDTERFLNVLNTLFSTGEVTELVALYAALPLFPHPELLKERAAEGIRTSMTVVFDAVALNNPYPADFLENDAWNQMVLKAVFLERPLYKIYGLDKRANKELAKMLSDFAHERWAASRYVTPELWRSVGPFLDERLIRDIEYILERGSDLEKQAAALAVKSSNFLKGRELLFSIPELKASIENNEFDWHTVAQKWSER